MTTIRKQGGYQTTATERMESARAVKSEALAREVCYARILARIWPAFIMRPSAVQQNAPLVCVIETPAGPLFYRIFAAEQELFADLPVRDNDGRMSDKLAILLALASDGWQ